MSEKPIYRLNNTLRSEGERGDTKLVPRLNAKIRVPDVLMPGDDIDLNFRTIRHDGAILDAGGTIRLNKSGGMEILHDRAMPSSA